MHAIKEKPVVVDGQIVIRPIMIVALTYDHRMLDGREAVTFLGMLHSCFRLPLLLHVANLKLFSARQRVSRGPEEDVVSMTDIDVICCMLDGICLQSRNLHIMTNIYIPLLNVPANIESVLSISGYAQ